MCKLLWQCIFIGAFTYIVMCACSITCVWICKCVHRCTELRTTCMCTSYSFTMCTCYFARQCIVCAWVCVLMLVPLHMVCVRVYICATGAELDQMSANVSRIRNMPTKCSELDNTCRITNTLAPNMASFGPAFTQCVSGAATHRRFGPHLELIRTGRGRARDQPWDWFGQTWVDSS